MRIPKGGIGFFDSGIGGLTVLAACEKYFKEGIFYYYGDNGHAPYGNLPPEKIKKYVFKAFNKFRRLRVRAVVIACNTATAVCVEELRKKYPFPIIGAEPAIYTAASKGGEVLALVTRATFESERFRGLCDRAQKIFPDCKINSVACDALAGEIERNLSNDAFNCEPFLPKVKADAVVLGCTHYVYVKEQIKSYYRCAIYDGNEGIARQLFKVLEGEKSKSRDGQPPVDKNRSFLEFLTTQPFVLKNRNQGALKANKRSLSKRLNALKNQAELKIYFLGKGGEYNRKTYKQTYVRGDLK